MSLIEKEKLISDLKSSGLIAAEEIVDRAPEVDAIPVQWMVDCIKENFWARCDVMKMIDEWHYYISTKRK